MTFPALPRAKALPPCHETAARAPCGYATWLLFRDEVLGSEFLEIYPQHGLDGRLAKIEADREALTAKLQNGLRRGDLRPRQAERLLKSVPQAEVGPEPPPFYEEPKGRAVASRRAAGPAAAPGTGERPLPEPRRLEPHHLFSLPQRLVSHLRDHLAQPGMPGIAVVGGMPGERDRYLRQLDRPATPLPSS